MLPWIAEKIIEQAWAGRLPAEPLPREPAGCRKVHGGEHRQPAEMLRACSGVNDTVGICNTWSIVPAMSFISTPSS
jgi:hypothetical protein